MGALMGGSKSNTTILVTNKEIKLIQSSCGRHNGIHLRFDAHALRSAKPYSDHVLGTVTIFQYGAGQAGVMRTLGKYIVGSGATFRHASTGKGQYDSC